MSSKKKPSPAPLLSRIVFIRFLIAVFAFISIWTIFHLTSQFKQQSASKVATFTGMPKIAFLFLVRRKVLLEFLWDGFFKQADPRSFSIYVHSEPGFALDESNTMSEYFHGRQLNNSVQVEWGGISMIKAEKLLFEAATGDIYNQRFILISDSCVPLYNFTFRDIKERQYDPRMSPAVPKDTWRKGSQWVALNRRHAEIVVNDTTIFQVFENFCKRWPPYGFGLLMLRDISQLKSQRNCIPDEHYVQTLLAIGGFEDEFERRSLTYTLWNQAISMKREKTWHPVTFDYGDMDQKKLAEIKDIKHVYLESEQRTEWCGANSAFAPCFLFARKFTTAAARQLVDEAII